MKEKYIQWQQRLDALIAQVHTHNAAAAVTQMPLSATLPASSTACVNRDVIFTLMPAAMVVPPFMQRTAAALVTP